MNLRRDVFQAIADPSRRAILLLLATQSMSAGAIAANFDTARPTVSKHLKILTECELLKQEHQGREVYYHFNPNKMKEIADYIEPFRQMWDAKFNTLESVMKKFDETGAWNLPVVDNGLYIGFISKSSVFSSYRAKLKAGIIA